MKIQSGDPRPHSAYGPGILILLTSDEVAAAIDLWLESKGVEIHGPRTTKVGGKVNYDATIYVDPQGDVTAKVRYSGRTGEIE